MAHDVLADKPDMVVHHHHPFNGELAPHRLDDPITPTARLFVRNNGDLPQRARDQNPDGWTLTIDGEVERPRSWTLDELHALPSVTLPLVLECAGNGRTLFDPPVPGTPWQLGAVGCCEWTGVPLAHLLDTVGVLPSAVYTAHYGEDEGVRGRERFSRGIPIAKALEEHTLVAYALNGEPLPAYHGYPARLIVPGWIGSCSQKWLSRIWIRDRVHDSERMSGYAYRMPDRPVAPGERPPKSAMEIATECRVKALITRPAAEVRVGVDQPVRVAGHAWAGERQVSTVRISIDRGTTWTEATLTPPPNRYAWARFEASIRFSAAGPAEIWAQAIDDRGDAQPIEQPWNPEGYLGNGVQRLPILVDG
ncbi:MAG: sulfite oxidase [Acidobacteriota bacterium]